MATSSPAPARPCRRRNARRHPRRGGSGARRPRHGHRILAFDHANRRHRRRGSHRQSARRPSSATVRMLARGRSRHPSTSARPTGRAAAAPGWPGRTSSSREPPPGSSGLRPSRNGPPRYATTAATRGGNSRHPAGRAAAEAVSRHAALLAQARQDLASARMALDARDRRGGCEDQAAPPVRRRAPHADGRERRGRDRAGRHRVRERGDATARRAQQAGAGRGGPCRADRDDRTAPRSTPTPSVRSPDGNAHSRPWKRSSGRWRSRCRRDVQQVLEQIREAERQITAASSAYREFDERPGREHDKATRGRRDVLRSERQALGDAVGELFQQAAAFGDYARAELRPLHAGGTDRGPWPDATRWPDAERSQRRLDRGADQRR